MLSTVKQDFCGFGVSEAHAAGAHPALPDRLVYPERIEQFAADPSESLFNSPETVVDLIASALVRDTNGEVTAAAGHCRGSTLRHSTAKR